MDENEIDSKLSEYITEAIKENFKEENEFVDDWVIVATSSRISGGGGYFLYSNGVMKHEVDGLLRRGIKIVDSGE